MPNLSQWRTQAASWWSARSQREKLLAMGVGAAILPLAFGAWEMSQRTDYAVVYSGLSPRVGGSIIAALQKDNVPFVLKDNGNLIEVPKADAARVRLQLAEQGLPAQASSTLWNQLQNEKLGTSSFVEHTTYLRALESNLSRDIMSIHGVAGATVNLAIPRHTPFLERMPVPKAAVTVQIVPGVTLTQEQVFGITHLVASSVPGLHAADVTVVDQTGQALTAKASGSASSSILHLQQSVETAYRKQIIQMLSPLVGGAKNLRVVVDANIDLSHHQESSITYGMGHVVTAAVLSSADKGGMSSNAFGIPGALSNQPPGTPQAPITASTASTPTLTLAEIKAMMPASNKNQQHFRYVLDKTVGFRKDAPWRLRALSVSVLVNGRETTVAARVKQVKMPVAPVSSALSAKKTSTGKAPAVPIPRGLTFTPKTMAALQNMVSNAIHASAPQGAVNVTAMPFEQTPRPVPRAWWQRLSPWAVWNQVEWFLLGLIALFLLRKPIKGLATARKDAARAAEAAAQADGPDGAASGMDDLANAPESKLHTVAHGMSDGGAMLDLAGVSEGHLEDNMNIIKNLIRSDTTRAVEVIREWIGNLGEGEGNG